MLPKLANRVRNTLVSSGAGNLFICLVDEDTSVTGYQDVVETVGTDATFYYTLVSREEPSEWECGVGHLIDSSGSIFLVRDRILDSGTGSATNFTSGIIDLWGSAPAELLKACQTGNNLLINGGFNFFQRQAPTTATSRSDDTRCPLASKSSKAYIMPKNAPPTPPINRPVRKTMVSVNNHRRGQGVGVCTWLDS